MLRSSSGGWGISRQLDSHSPWTNRSILLFVVGVVKMGLLTGVVVLVGVLLALLVRHGLVLLLLLVGVS